MGYLEGQTAVVTGAGRGLGRAIALSLAAEGARIALIARSESELLTVKDEVSTVGSEAAVFVGDLTERTFRNGLPAAVTSTFGAAQILINNAGIAPSAPLAKTDDDFVARCLEINVAAPLALCRGFAPGMAEAGRGRIVNIASTAALKGYAYTAAYVASKHGLLGMTRALATELLKKGITVNAVCPGFADTKIAADAAANIVSTTGRSLDEAQKSLAQDGTLGRLIRPEEVARAVMLFLGPDSDALTGAALPVAGDAV